MTRLLLLGGHVVEVKAKGEDVKARLAAAGWTTRYYQHNRDHNGDLAGIEYDFLEPSYCDFEKSKGRGMVRVRTDSVVAIDG